MLLVVASREDQNAKTLIARLGSGRATLLSSEDLCRPGWLFDPLNPQSGQLVAGGKKFPQAAIRGVLTRRPHVFEAELTEVAAQDRSYVAAEVNSFLVAWLSSLRCPVLNRPVGHCLSGPSWRAEEWALLAASTGLRIRPFRRTLRLKSRPRPKPKQSVTAEVVTVGERWFGPVENDLGAASVRLARAAKVDLLSVRFDKGAFAGASSLPSLHQDCVLEAVLERIEGKRT
jgi:hypothetical protein